MPEITLADPSFFGIPRPILEGMTRKEVADYAEDVRREIAEMEAWNRPERTPRLNTFNVVPPAKSMAEYEWNVKSK
jgi:hypothetical protein